MTEEEYDDTPLPPPATGPNGDGAEDHVPDGLDLARSLARAAAKKGGPRLSRPKRRRTPGSGRASGAHPDDRDPQLLGSTVRRLVDDQGWDLSLRVHGVFGRWAQIVGEEIAQHATPESFVDGKLTVRTDSTAWATQLRLLSSDVLARLNAELGHGTVTLLEVVGPRTPSWVKGRRAVRDGRGPRDTYG